MVGSKFRNVTYSLCTNSRHTKTMVDGNKHPGKNSMGSKLVTAVAYSIREIRIENGLTQEKLAELAGLDRTYISGVERAVRNITLDTLAQIVGALNVDLPKFLEKVSERIDALPDQQESKYKLPVWKE